MNVIDTKAQQYYTVIAVAENKPGVMYRIAELFMKRKLNIASMTVSETEQAGMARFTIRLQATAMTVEKVVKQLYRIVEVTRVVEYTDEALVFCEVGLIKVHAASREQREEIKHLADMFGAKIVMVKPKFVVIEQAGSEEEVDDLLEMVRKFGLLSVVRSGRIATTKI